MSEKPFDLSKLPAAQRKELSAFFVDLLGMGLRRKVEEAES